MSRDVGEEYRRMSEAVGVADLSARGKIAVTGGDRLEWLNRIVTRDVARLASGASCRALAITAKGKLVADLQVHVRDDAIAIDCEPGLATATISALDRLLISEDAALSDVTREWGIISVQGPRARTVPVPATGVVAEVRRTPWGGLDVWVRAADFEAAFDATIREAVSLGGGRVSYEALETARVEWGDPRQGVDIDEETFALEAGLWGIISTTKGCYVGQEVVARVAARGHINRSLAGLLLDGDLPAARDSAVLAGGRQVGRTASSVVSPALGRAIAIAYLEIGLARSPGKRVAVAGHGEAVVVALPFVGDNPSLGPPRGE